MATSVDKNGSAMPTRRQEADWTTEKRFIRTYFNGKTSGNGRGRLADVSMRIGHRQHKAKRAKRSQTALGEQLGSWQRGGPVGSINHSPGLTDVSSSSNAAKAEGQKRTSATELLGLAATRIGNEQRAVVVDEDLPQLALGRLVYD